MTDRVKQTAGSGKEGKGMKDNALISKFMHFLVHNNILFTVAVMGMVHVTLLGIMLWANVPPLMYFNILSVVVYLFCILLCRNGHVLPAYVSILLEVSAYSVVSTYFIGWRSGSYCFLCSIVPIIIYFGCFLFKGSKRWIVVLSLVLDFMLYVVLYLLFARTAPVYTLAYLPETVLMIFSSFVMVFAVIFYNTIYIYASEVEMTSLEKKNEQLEVDIQLDVLTKLLNRRGFLPLVESLMKAGSNSHFCIAFCDIDNFKRINDSYGHDCGDEVLRHITKMIRREMMGCEICRWGGEEIIILMRDYDMTVAKMKLEYVRKHIESNPTIFYNKRIWTTVTIGVEEYKDIYKVPDDIIKVADNRMYYGKQHGKNILISEEMGQAG